MGGSAPSVPGPSATETALQQAQLDALKSSQAQIEKQNKTMELLAPLVYKSAGVQPTYDEKGTITGFTQVEDPLQSKLKTLQGEFYDRTQNALEGKLPVDPGLLQSLAEQEQQFKERMRKQLGPGWETSTPGIEARAKFDLTKNNVLEGARRGDLSMAESLGLAANAANLGQQGQNFGQIMTTAGAPLASASAYGGVAQGFGQAAGALANERLANYQAQLGGYQNQQKTFGSLFGGIGQLGGMALFGPLGGGVGGASGNLFGKIIGAGTGGQQPIPSYLPWSMGY